MENKSQPLSPHLQVYRWHISSLLSISHRIVGVINFFCIIFVLSLLIFIQGNNQILQFFSVTFLGKFFVISLCWSFSFQILNEIRHLAWDMGYGFDLKVSQITGIATILGSFILAILFYFAGKSFI
jgi:succinate dehydrogenase / fumarate reductase cytochrome b subunit